jgi:hypothetical protein
MYSTKQPYILYIKEKKHKKIKTPSCSFLPEGA